MPTLKILIFPDPRLRTVATTVDVIDEGIKTLVKDMLEAMYEGNGIGLAATQVDFHKRILVIDVSEEKNEPLVLINPLLEEIIEPKKCPIPRAAFLCRGFTKNLKGRLKLE
jgi:peptide deformylase